MIVVTGGTGKLGSQIVQRLQGLVPAEQIGVSVRDVGRAGDLGVRVRRGDFGDPQSLAEAFEGASQVLIVSANETGGKAVESHVTAIEAAVAAGAGRILYTSHQGAAEDSLFAPMPDHAATEAHLAKVGTPFTVLRNGFYASTVPQLLGAALETGELVAPADGPVSWTAHADLAEAAAIILASDGSFEGPTPPLTAPVALDLTDAARILSELTGRTIRRVVADDEEWVTSLTGHGVPAPQAQMLLGMFHASRRGEFAEVSPELERLLGRPATPLRSVLAEAIEAAA
ncbi:NAD(P)H-binding protein [Amycolatopsis sp., V23-08]|uniref:NAD(P)H-binding protein n=1 Tax=Amycolatopsis heterodermiae TaxID=3110235 RepID=A0ABU5RI46_9PSEU|nr:NAD(P)H-binding protein [Amycolatopsis sp., V23-08]MEA5365495.1 NAD(P)H-binding protein [Amycolatopsis sp., V23-08]